MTVPYLRARDDVPVRTPTREEITQEYERLISGSETPQPRTSGRGGLSVASNIRMQWAPTLLWLGKFDSMEELLEGQYCWACGMTSTRTLDRAHILAASDGGTDRVENLHLLCRGCHRASEYFYGKVYWEWFQAAPAHRMRAGMLALSVLDPDSWAEMRKEGEDFSTVVSRIEAYRDKAIEQLVVDLRTMSMDFTWPEIVDLAVLRD